MTATKHIEHLPFTTKSVIGSRARIGLVVLASDYTLENEFKQVINQTGVDLYHSRIANAPDITPETLRAMGPTMTETASRLLPNDDLDVLASSAIIHEVLDLEIEVRELAHVQIRYGPKHLSQRLCRLGLAESTEIGEPVKNLSAF